MGSGYQEFEFAVPTRTEGDCMARYHVRIAELHESVKICRQALDRLQPGPVRTADRKVMPPPRAYITRTLPGAPLATYNTPASAQ